MKFLLMEKKRFKYVFLRPALGNTISLAMSSWPLLGTLRTICHSSSAIFRMAGAPLPRRCRCRARPAAAPLPMRCGRPPFGGHRWTRRSGAMDYDALRAKSQHPVYWRVPRPKWPTAWAGKWIKGKAITWNHDFKVRSKLKLLGQRLFGCSRAYIAAI